MVNERVFVVEHLNRNIKSFSLQICEHQISLHKVRCTRMNNRVQRYFNSSMRRNVFARLMCKGSYLDKWYSISDISEELFLTRQTAHRFVSDCLAEGWIIKKQNCRPSVFRAAPILTQHMENYAEAYKEELISLEENLQSLKK